MLRKSNYDEYYTIYEEVEWIFNNLTIPVKDKIIYCFCDSEESNFVKYFKDHEKELGYKELIYTWDDYNTHMDLFNKADIIITNPPFSKLADEIIPILNKVDKDYFLFGSITSIYGYRNILPDNVYIYRRKDFCFYTPHINKNGTHYINFGRTCYITTIKQTFFNKKIIKKDYNDRIYWKGDNKEGLMVDRLNLIPDDYDGYMMVPITVLLDPVRENYDIIKNTVDFNYKVDDNKNRFRRTLIKNKRKIL